MPSWAMSVWVNSSYLFPHLTLGTRIKWGLIYNTCVLPISHRLAGNGKGRKRWAARNTGENRGGPMSESAEAGRLAPGSTVVTTGLRSSV